MDSRDKSYQNASRAKGIEMWFGNVGALTGAAVVVSVTVSMQAPHAYPVYTHTH